MVISPSPFPTNGLRPLSSKEALQRAKALSCTTPQDAKPSCSGQIFVGMFFDGTGNNLNNDYATPSPEKRKHTNVVKLFHCYKQLPRQGYLRYYVPGVGTPFPEIGEAKPASTGSTAAGGGEQRIAWGILSLINAPHEFVFGTPLIESALAKTVTDNMSGSLNPPAMRRFVLNNWQEKLQAALKGQKPRVEQINLSVFGFSRGAAQARVFVNWLFEVCKQESGGWTFAGIPIRLQFLGILDTVASVGAANLFDEGMLAGHQSWADNALQIHSAVEQCVHFVAGHEVRACFPLDTVRVKNTYPANAKEVMYPGAHSDVGGGYPPGALGIDVRPNSSMSVIVGANMYKEAVLAGVPLIPMKQLPPEFREALTPADTTVADFNAYLTATKIGDGPVGDIHRKHMMYYHTYRFKHRANYTSVGPWKFASSAKNIDDKGKATKIADAEVLEITQKEFMQSLSLGMFPPSDTNWTPKQAVQLHKDMNKAAGLSNRTSYPQKLVYEIAASIDVDALTPAIEKFCGEYIHDSVAGFIGFGMHEYTFNKLGIAKYRGIFNGND